MLNSDIDISTTKSEIFHLIENGYSIGDLQLALDGKIYVAITTESIFDTSRSELNMNLSVINNPSGAGLMCDFDTSTIWLGGKRATYALPNMPNYNLGALEGSECDTLATAVNNLPEINNEIIIYPNPTREYFSIKQYSSVAKVFALTISDVLGQNVLQILEVMPDMHVNVNHLKSGIYMLKIMAKDNTTSAHKLIIAK